jgi:hypothetical protein
MVKCSREKDTSSVDVEQDRDSAADATITAMGTLDKRPASEGLV